MLKKKNPLPSMPLNSKWFIAASVPVTDTGFLERGFIFVKV